MRIIEQVAKIIEEIVGTSDITEEMDLKSDVGLDSLSIVNLIVGLEEVYEVEFDESDLDPSMLNTVQDVIILVEKTI